MLTNAGSPRCEAVVLGRLNGGSASEGKVIPARARRHIHRRGGCQADQRLEGEVRQQVVDPEL